MNPPAFQFYADDFIAGVADMTQNEVGAYIMLLAHGWNTQGLKAGDPDRLKILAKGDVSDHVLGKFKLKNGRLVNKRQEHERKKQSDYRAKQAINGAKGGRPITKPKPNPSLSFGLTQTEPKKSSPSPSPSPSPLKDKRENGASLSLADIQKVFDTWNSMAEKSGLPKCLLVSDKRRRSLEIRLRDDFFINNWQLAISRISASKFCAGDSERGWRASFDWFITPDAVVKIMEGKYDTVERQQEEQRAY